ncbi:MAG TPA: TylF/MycF/NovP-related O-methyltransferase [Caulobacteraceae bacterium]|nr:TylF/MycF/NovP-related O-methyltransferase [Caulobacteraceae bacterium]
MALTPPLKSGLRKAARALGYSIQRLDAEPPPHPLEREAGYAGILSRVAPFTMTSPERIGALVDAVRYATAANIPGAIVECGVWRGGSMMAAALALLETGDIRDLYLFDTFAGMTAPTADDVDHAGLDAAGPYADSMADDHNEWCYASLEDVRRNLLSTGYPAENCHFVQGDVLQTIPIDDMPDIAVLRLDTDWYESTRHELTHLYPRLSKSGVLIIDDYGHWQGCRKAVDEYFSKQPLFMFRIDYTGRMAVRP